MIPVNETLLRQLLEQIDPALQHISGEEIAALVSHSREVGIAPVPAQVNINRWEDALIEQLIPAGARVLDVGCGEGELLAKLISSKQVLGQGIEVDGESVMRCIGRGVPVVQMDADNGLSELPDQSFDYVVLEETLQTVRRPVDLLREMIRVGRRGIVSFPNFAFWRVRLDLLLRGRMPVTEELPWRWYDTPNIHLFCLQDFLDWVSVNAVRVVDAYVYAGGQSRPLQQGDNLYAEECLFVVER
jgi:methionine biosynthesis protein MetW